MKIEMDNITVIYPNENSGVSRKLTIKDDGELLQMTFIGQNDKQSGGISLTKTQMMLLRDNLNTIIKNKLVK